jgi:hypothetical protein
MAEGGGRERYCAGDGRPCTGEGEMEMGGVGRRRRIMRAASGDGVDGLKFVRPIVPAAVHN